MNTEHYKAASEATDESERALTPAFKRTQVQPIAHERDYYKERYNEKLMEAEQWLLERNAALAHADKLAEALKAAQAWLIACSDKDYTYARQAIAIKASEALAAYEEGKQ